MYSIDHAYAICNATSDSGYLLEEQVIKIKYKDFDCTDSILVAIKINIWTNFKIGLSPSKKFVLFASMKYLYKWWTMPFISS